MAFKPGQIVKVTDSDGKALMRRVVIDRGKMVVVCNEKEFQDASVEQRNPDGIGFPAELVKLARQHQ